MIEGLETCHAKIPVAVGQKLNLRATLVVKTREVVAWLEWRYRWLDDL
jgi:hypothetical protein